MSEALRVKTAVFEGPIDLLLTLAQRRELDLNQVRLAELTHDYLAAVLTPEAGQAPVEPEAMAAFLVVGAKLLALKAAALLPAPVSPEEEDLEVWEDQVRERMQEYRRFKEAALELMRRHTEGGFSFVSAIEAEVVPAERLEIAADALAAAFQAVLERLPAPDEVQVQLHQYSLADEIENISQKLREHDRVSFSALFDGAGSRLQAVVIFLALLELIRLGRARVRQRAVFAEIEVSRGPGLE